MASPFPGMDPYLEAPGIFPDLHQGLAYEIRDALNQKLPAGYYARLESRPEVGIGDDEAAGDPATRRVVPDVAVQRDPQAPPPLPPPPRRVGVAMLERLEGAPSRSYEVVVSDEAVNHSFVEVFDSTSGHRLVTLIEIVSPSNKRAGADRRAYLEKQLEVQRRNANVVEIDLLRAGRRLLAGRRLEEFLRQIGPPNDYLVVVSRYWRRVSKQAGFQLFPFGLREPLPSIDVPLHEGEDEVPLDLQALFTRVYDSGPYRRGAVNYNRPAPPPALSEQDAEWADQILRGAGLRGAA